jgi:hypothetical protein
LLGGFDRLFGGGTVARVDRPDRVAHGGHGRTLVIGRDPDLARPRAGRGQLGWKQPLPGLTEDAAIRAPAPPMRQPLSA